MSSINIAGDTSGSIAIAAPAIAGSNTITLPAETGTLLSSVSSGVLVNRAYAEYLTYTSMSPTIPADNTIPLISEGTEILSVSITPKTTTNRVRIFFQCFATTASGADQVTAALFVNGGTNAICASNVTTTTAAYGSTLVMLLEHIPGSVSAQTYTIRIGAQTYVCYVNGSPANRYYGGVARATVTLEEFAP